MFTDDDAEDDIWEAIKDCVAARLDWDEETQEHIGYEIVEEE